MKESDIKNQACGFEGDILAYLYEEADVAERRSFEGHVATCSSCSDEYLSLLGASSAVSEWRSVEFADLATPNIRFRPDAEDRVASYSSIWAALRSFRFVIPGLAAAAVFVVLGLVFFMRSPAFDVDRAADSAAAVPVSLPSAETRGSDGVGDVAVQPEVFISESPRGARVATQAEQSEGRNVVVKTRHASVVKTPVRRSPPIRFEGSVAKGQRSTPTLNGFEDKEDETLRLEDIFSEIDAS